MLIKNVRADYALPLNHLTYMRRTCISALKTPHRHVSGSVDLGCTTSQEEEQKEPHQGPTRSRVELGPKSRWQVHLNQYRTRIYTDLAPYRVVALSVIPISFIAIAHRSVYFSQRGPRLSQCRPSFVCITHHRRDSPRAGHDPRLPLFRPESESGNTRYAGRTSTTQIRAYKQHAHRADVPIPHVRPPDSLAHAGPHRPG